jgi:hypothetical protein
VTRSNRRFAFGETVLAQSNGEGDAGFGEEGQPLRPDELPVRKEKPDARDVQEREIAPHQRDPLLGVRAAGTLDHAPDQRHAEARRHGGQHEEVDVALAHPPLGSVERERPGALQPEQLRRKRRRPVGPEFHVLEEALQPAIGRGHQRRTWPLAGDVGEVDGPRADHAHNEECHGVAPVLAQRHVRA